jgi:hypothetical protein
LSSFLALFAPLRETQFFDLFKISNIFWLGVCRKKTFVNGVRKQISDNAASNSNLPRTPRAGWSLNQTALVLLH